MKAKLIVFTLALCVVGAAVCFAANSNMGTWKLNEAKSKLIPGMGKNTMVVYEEAGDSVKITVDGVGGDGNATHNEWTGKFDGKDYPVTGDPNSDMRSYKQVNDRTLHAISMKDGKATVDIHIVVSKDGKTRTVTAKGTDPKGKKFSITAVYDKQ